MAVEPRDTVRKYVLASQHYLENALNLLNRQEAAKAGEFIWGSMAQAVQAVAASRGTPLANHRSLRWFVGQLARELNDKTIVEGFAHAEHLHSNFHEVELDTRDVVVLVEPIRTVIFKLLNLIPKELLVET